MSHTILMSETEIESSSLSASYEEVIAAGENQNGVNMMFRNTTTFRLQFRVNGDDSNTFTISPGEKFLIGGFNKLIGQKIEVRTVTDVVASIRINLYG